MVSASADQIAEGVALRLLGRYGVVFRELCARERHLVSWRALLAVFRAKGIARTATGWLAFQAVGGRLHTDTDAAAPAHGESRLVFFGRGLDGAALGARLAACQHPRSG